MTGLSRRIAWNLRHRWRRIFALLVIGIGVAAPLITGLWWSLPLVWFFGLFVALPVLHTLTKPVPDEDSDDSDANAPDDPALRALRERYARGGSTSASSSASSTGCWRPKTPRPSTAATPRTSPSAFATDSGAKSSGFASDPDPDPDLDRDRHRFARR